MVAQMWSGGIQPQTAPPLFIPISTSISGIEPTLDGGTFEGPLLIQLHCSTQGASVAYSTDTGDDAR